MVSMGRALERQSAAVRGPDLKLFIKDVRDRQQRKRAITVRSWSTVQEVKHTIQKIMHVPPSAQRLYFGPLLSSGGELPNHRTLHDAGIYRSGETLLLDIKVSNSAASPYATLRATDGNDICISSSMIDSTPRVLRSLVQKARRGFLMGLKPELVLDGSGGTYFLHDAKKAKIAVFKPADEEPYAENNPRGYIKQPGQNMALREGVVPGEACMREVAAFLLDHGGFAGVPLTTLTEARHPAFNNNGSRLKVAEGGASIGSHSITSSTTGSNGKKVGSFQEFVRCECTMDDISPSKISVSEIHKIAILDIRIMNADRNSANLLVRRRRDNTLELVPIDHGFCLRTEADVSWMDWCWLDWPQLKQPLCPEHVAYIKNLDIEADARLLKEQLNIHPDAVDYFRASSRILKAGVQAGLTLYDIAIMCCRNDDLGELPSKLEMLFSMAEELSLSALENGKWHHTAASRALAEQLTPRGAPLLPQQTRRSSMSCCPDNHSRMYKSASSVHFSGIIGDLEGALAEDDSKKDFPGMAQSSASDSSSEAGDGDVVTEKEECDDWAANLLTNISMDRTMSIVEMEGPKRCSSMDSEDSDSNEVSGFWQKRPGDVDVDDDESSWTFSPESSPIHHVEVMNPIESFPISLPETPLKASDGIRETYRTPSVHFADDTWLEQESKKGSTPENASKAMPLPKVEPTRMKRSQSYSAVSALSAPTRSDFLPKNTKPVSRLPDPCTKEYEQFRDYFLKFVDLVIVRETKAASVQSQVNHITAA